MRNQIHWLCRSIIHGKVVEVHKQTCTFQYEYVYKTLMVKDRKEWRVMCLQSHMGQGRVHKSQNDCCSL